VIGVVVSFAAALVKVAAEDGWVGCPVTLVTAGLPTDKTAVDADSFFELEGGVPVIVPLNKGGQGVVNLPSAFIGVVCSLRYPDFVA
jgi:hypothetical protein